MTEKIFWASKEAFADSDAALKKIFSAFYGIKNPTISRTKNGKPFAQNGPHFSVTHTSKGYFFAFSDEEVGIDAELRSRKVAFRPILRRLNAANPIVQNEEKFVELWTKLESAVKYFGGTLARDLKETAIVDGGVRRGDEFIPLLFTTNIFKEHVVSVCSKKSFDGVPWIEIL